MGQELGHGGRRGHPTAELCREKIGFYAFKLECWKPGDAMGRAGVEEVLHWWEFELGLAEQRLVREINALQPRY
jgi:hypothetical protein